MLNVNDNKIQVKKLNNSDDIDIDIKINFKIDLLYFESCEASAWNFVTFSYKDSIVK